MPVFNPQSTHGKFVGDAGGAAQSPNPAGIPQSLAFIAALRKVSFRGYGRSSESSLLEPNDHTRWFNIVHIQTNAASDNTEIYIITI